MGARLAFPTDLSSFLELIRQHQDAAYSIIFAYAFSHSLLFGLFAGYAAHAKVVGLEALIVVCWIGSFLGDVLRFWVGRRYGTRLISGYPRLVVAAETVARLTDRHNVWMILLHRYPHGIRGVAGFAYGMSSIGWPRFLVLNAIAAGIWSVAIVSAGYAFGHLSETALNDASSKLGLVMLAVFLGLSWYLSKRLEQVIERNAAAKATP
jgi:membrane protein DedA with SNARE-associated domain